MLEVSKFFLQQVSLEDDPAHMADTWWSCNDGGLDDPGATGFGDLTALDLVGYQDDPDNTVRDSHDEGVACLDGLAVIVEPRCG